MTPAPIPSTPLVAADRPLVLMPVRLETRFAMVERGRFAIKIRVYPDTIHTDTHEPGVTLSEAEWGRHYWQTVWRAASDVERRKAAWRQMAERYEPQRASWIVWHLRPLNINERPRDPVPADAAVTPAPRFPEPPQLNIQAESWTRPPWSRVLPDQWIAIGYLNGAVIAVAQSGQILDPLPLGPAPTADVNPKEDEAPVDAGMKWIVDFEEAVRVGMGLQLLLPAPFSALDRLLVFGVKGSLNSDASAERLAELLAAQSYTQGFSFVAPGTPSNNTADAASGFSSFDAGYEASFQANQPQDKLDEKWNGPVAAKALGIPAATFTRMERSTVDDMTSARQMNTALWQTTWGYFLEQMMSGAVSDPDTNIPWARRHFVEHVRAAGPLPAIRCGRQPYGLLPVTSLELWRPRIEDGPDDRQTPQLISVLARLRGVWMRASENAPRVGKTTDPKQDVLDVLRLDATSGSYAIRAAIGRHYFQNLWQFQLIDLESQGWWTRLSQLLDGSLRGMGFFGLNSRLNSMVYGDDAVAIKAVLVQPGVVTADTRLNPNFLTLLLNTPVAGIRAETFPEPKPAGLLYVLLRHAALLEYSRAAQNILIAGQLMSPVQRREAEIVEVDPAETLFTPWRQLDTAVPGVPAVQRLDVFLQTLTSFSDPNVAQLGEFRASLRNLAALTASKLERLMTGTLDVCSYRLDAWITSIATRRLTAMRRANPKGVYLGSYGWMENLKAAAQRPTAATVPEESALPAFALPENPGFIHAPSIPQAATAAVLRSGHLTHQNVESGKLLAIDLSSARVRLAKWLLDGVRAGQPLGALLGYRFERGLHEGHPGVELDRFIAPFREMAPLAARKLDAAAGLPVEAIAANNVVDGLRLQQLWREAQSNEAAFFTKLGTITEAQKQAIRTELAALDDAVDAVSDALMAESVHQAVLGNPSRASATLDAVARGDARPPELDVIETPRTGIALTHRALVLFSGAAPAAAGWTARFPFRAEAEPHLNAWAGQLLGKPASVRCRVERLDAGTGAVAETREVRLADLGLAPLDLVYAAESSEQAKRSELEQRLLIVAAQQAPGFGPDELLRVNLDRDRTWAARDLSVNEFLEVLRTVRALITRARGIDGRDLVATGVGGVSGIDDAALGQRATRAMAALEAALAKLKAEPGPDTLLALAHFGIAGAIPADAAQLTAQAPQVAREAAGRLERARAASSPADALREVFGPTFVVTAVFRPPNADELAKTWGASAQLQGGNPMEAAGWLARASRVREGMARIEDAYRYAEALSTGAELNLVVGQLPLRDGDRWVALPLADGKPLAAGTLSLVAQVSGSFDARKPLTGLLIDEWIETVPNATETTAVAFQYDQPDAAPPQCVLIAVPPGNEHAWTADTLHRVLVETMDLARVRVVDPAILGEIHHFLPALHFANNAQGDTVSTDWIPLTR